MASLQKLTSTYSESIRPSIKPKSMVRVLRNWVFYMTFFQNFLAWDGTPFPNPVPPLTFFVAPIGKTCLRTRSMNDL